MLAAVLKDFNQLVLEDIPIPEPGPGEACVRIKVCGFRAADYKAIKGIRRNLRFSELIVGYIEKYWCPSILSKDLTRP